MVDNSPIYEFFSAWSWERKEYIKYFDNKNGVSPKDMRKGKNLTPHNKYNQPDGKYVSLSLNNAVGHVRLRLYRLSKTLCVLGAADRCENIAF